MIRSKNRRAFSLLELVVVIGITGLLAGLFVGTVQSIRESAACASCQLNLKQIAVALHNYHDGKKRFPDVVVKIPAGKRIAALQWMAALLPFIERDALWQTTLRACQSNRITFVNPPHEGVATVIPLYTCPSDGRLGRPLLDRYGVTASYSSYIAVAGDTRANGAMAWPGIRFAQITDGVSNTLLVGERPPYVPLCAGWWYSLVSPGPIRAEWGPNAYLSVAQPTGSPTCLGPFRFGPGRIENPCDRFHFWSLHSSGANFAFADGSVRFLSYSADSILPALSTRAGGETVTIP